MSKSKNKNFNRTQVKDLNPNTESETIQSVKPKKTVGYYTTKFIQYIIGFLELGLSFSFLTNFLNAMVSSVKLTSLNQITTITAVNVFVLFVGMKLSWEVFKKIVKYDFQNKVFRATQSDMMKEAEREELSNVKETAKGFVQALGFGKKG